MRPVRHRKTLALDFDGVICSSSAEVLLTALEAYLEFVPQSRFRERFGSLRNHPSLDAAVVNEDPLASAFQPLVPLGNRAEDFGAALCAVEREVEIADQAAYDSFFQSLDSEWLNAYHNRFYTCRNRSRERDIDLWLRLHSAYAPFVDVLRRKRTEKNLAIATAKDGRSVRLLLKHFRIDDLFPDELILDKDTAVKKSTHLKVIAERCATPLSDTTFVDDKVNHLETVAALGVRLVLAGWGYNTQREHRRASELGYPVATLDSAESVLFGDHS